MPGKSILIADDDPGMVEFLTTALQASGLQVDSAESTEDLVQKLRAATPDLIVLDMGMPVMGAQLVESAQMLAAASRNSSNRFKPSSVRRM